MTAVTGLVYLLEPFVPVFSLGALYVLAVLPIAVFWGRAYSIGVAVASVLTFNYFFLPPVLKFTLSGEENWLTLAIYIVTGLLVADLAARARRRAREAEQREREAALLAELSTVLLSGAEVSSELVRIAEGTARLLGVASARIELGTRSAPRAGEAPLELRAGRAVRGHALRHAGGSTRARSRASAFSPRSRPCSASRSSGSGWRARRSRPRRCGGATR